MKKSIYYDLYNIGSENKELSKIMHDANACKNRNPINEEIKVQVGNGMLWQQLILAWPMKQVLILLLAALVLGCSADSATIADSADTPDNIVLMIGDGMGLSSVSLGFYFQDKPSQFSRFRHIGLARTSSAKQKITDSAAAGTAMACGVKTYNGAIGVDTLKTEIPSITELVSSLGWSTGVVATSSVAHATPASFYAHVPRRGMTDEIAEQLLQSDIDFFAGGGKKFFNARKDGQNLFLLAKEKGFVIDTLSLAQSGSLDPRMKYGFMPVADKMPPALKGRGDFLPRATSLAMDHLSNNEQGFFLMVEASQIDGAGHANDIEYSIGEQLDFEEVIKNALDFAEKDGNTLVVVTADHETGGLGLSSKINPETGRRDYREIEPGFVYDGHTATLVPVFAYGPGAEEFTGIYENTEIFWKMKALIEE